MRALNGPKASRSDLLRPDLLALATVVGHLRDLESSLPGLQVGGSGSLTYQDVPVEPEKGVLVTLRPDGDRCEARLWISPDRMKLKAREQKGGLTELEDRFTVSLGESPVWGKVRFRSPMEFAAALVRFMERRLADLSVSPEHFLEEPPAVVERVG